MNFPPPNRRSRVARRWVALGAVFVIATLLVSANAILDGRLSGLVRAPMAMWGSGETVARDALALASEAFAGAQGVDTERERLKERVRELEIYALNNQVLRAENDELRRLLGSSTSTALAAPSTGTLVRVVSHGGVMPYGTLVLDATAETLSDGTYVYGTENVAIGTIAPATSGSAVVDLFSRSGREVNILLHTEGATVSLHATGKGNGNFDARVPRDVAVAPGDAAVLAARSDAILGYVGSIETSPTDAFKTLRIRTPVNFSTIRFVHIR